MKKISIVLATALLSMSFIGCQKTPDSPIVIGKDYDKMVNQALLGQPTDEPIAEQIGAVDEYNYVQPLTNAVGNIEVHVNAKVAVSDSSKMTFAKVSRDSFSLEEITKYVETLFDGQKTYSGETAVSKPAMLLKIEKVKAEMAETTDEKGLLILEETLKKYEKELSKYGESDGLVEKQIEFTINKDNYNEEKMFLVTDGSDGIFRSIKISNHDEFRKYSLVYQTSRNGYPDIHGIYNMTDERNTSFGIDDYGNPDDLEPLIKSEDEAVIDANQLLSELGLQDFVAKDVDIVFGSINGKVQKAYRIAYTRAMNGVSFNYTLTNEAEIGTNMAVDDGKGGKMPVWENETLTVMVANEGVVQLEFLNPLNVDEIVTEYTKMKDFDSIMDIFKKMILIHYANVPDGEMRVIEIDKIELGLMRVLEPNSMNTGVVIPVWDFYGKINGEDYEDSDKTFLTINAIDGSIIDRTVGY